MRSYTSLRIALGLSCIGPLIEGAAALISGELVIKLYEITARSSVTLTPELNFLFKPLGLYLVMYGGLLAYAMINPERDRTIILWGALLSFLRVIQRLFLTPTLHELFKVPVWISLVQIAWLSVLTIALFVLRPRRASVPSVALE